VAAASDEEIQDLVRRMATLLSDIDDAGLQATSIVTEAESGLFEDRGREPVLSSLTGGPVLLRYELDAFSLRRWLAGTDLGRSLARFSDEEITATANRADGMRDGPSSRFEDYADALAELVVRGERERTDAQDGGA
jgi:hypothetical protein